MIDITESAQNYFQKLLEGQDAPGSGLRIKVLDPGTPRAGCDLQFAPPGAGGPGDRRVSFSGFDLFVEKQSEPWLEEAVIDFEESDTGGQLTIRAPNIKGQGPSDDADLAERIAWVLETEINPSLAGHGGRVALQEITPDNAVVLQFGGGCHGCGMVDVTLKDGIEKTLTGHFPEISGVIDATDHATGSNPYYAPRD